MELEDAKNVESLSDNAQFCQEMELPNALYKLPRQEFQTFLAERGEKKLEFQDPWHGRFEIYEIRWD